MEAIAAMSPSSLQVMTDLINDANRARPRIFPGDRLAENTIQDDYRDCVAIFAEGPTQLVACVLVKPIESALWLYLLAVSARLQGQGLGRQTILAAGRFAQDASLARLELEAVDSGGLVPYYRKLGFEEATRTLKPAGHWHSSTPFELVKMTRPVLPNPANAYPADDPLQELANQP